MRQIFAFELNFITMPSVNSAHCSAFAANYFISNLLDYLIIFIIALSNARFSGIIAAKFLFAIPP